MERNPTTAALTQPTMIGRDPIAPAASGTALFFTRSFNCKARAPSIAGIERRKEN